MRQQHGQGWNPHSQWQRNHARGGRGVLKNGRAIPPKLDVPSRPKCVVRATVKEWILHGMDRFLYTVFRFDGGASEFILWAAVKPSMVAQTASRRSSATLVELTAEAVAVGDKKFEYADPRLFDLVELELRKIYNSC